MALRDSEARIMLKRVGSRDIQRSKKKISTIENEFLLNDEEITSSEDDKSITASLESEDEAETPTAKRRRIAKQYLNALKSSLDDSTDIVSQALEKDRLNHQEPFFRNVHDKVTETDMISEKRLLKAYDVLTSCCLSNDELSVITGSKDGSVVEWRTETGSKKFLRDRYTYRSMEQRSSEILCVALDSNHIRVAGGRDKNVRIFDTRCKISEICVLTGHKDAVTSVGFLGDDLYSASLDRCLKKWDMRTMSYVETLFGHQGGILQMHGYDKVFSCSLDRTIRLWNSSDENHSVYRGSQGSIECISALSKDYFVSGDQCGSLNLWKINQRRPISSVLVSHGTSNNVPNWITGLVTLRNSNVIASASCDGYIRLWDTESNILIEKMEIHVKGIVNGLCITNNILVAATGREHKMGRWWIDKKCQNGLVIMKLKPNDA